MESGYSLRISLNFLKAGMPEAFQGTIKKGRRICKWVYHLISSVLRRSPLFYRGLFFLVTTGLLIGTGAVRGQGLARIITI
jgi:hypothetical protein